MVLGLGGFWLNRFILYIHDWHKYYIFYTYLQHDLFVLYIEYMANMICLEPRSLKLSELHRCCKALQTSHPASQGVQPMMGVKNDPGSSFGFVCLFEWFVVFLWPHSKAFEGISFTFLVSGRPWPWAPFALELGQVVELWAQRSAEFLLSNRFQSKCLAISQHRIPVNKTAFL